MNDSTTPLVPISDDCGAIPGAFRKGDELVLTAPVYDVDTVARLADVHPETLRRAARKKRVRASILGHGYKFSATETRRILEEGI